MNQVESEAIIKQKVKSLGREEYKFDFHDYNIGPNGFVDSSLFNSFAYNEQTHELVYFGSDQYRAEAIINTTFLEDSDLQKLEADIRQAISQLLDTLELSDIITKNRRSEIDSQRALTTSFAGIFSIGSSDSTSLPYPVVLIPQSAGTNCLKDSNIEFAELSG